MARAAIQPCACAHCTPAGSRDWATIAAIAVGFVLIPGRVAIHYAMGLLQ